MLWPGLAAYHTHLWYASGKNRMPVGDTGAGYHVMFPMRWNLATDQFDFYLATSPDNATWGLVGDAPIGVPGAPGSWDCECLRPGVGMVALPDGRMALLCSGQEVPHKYARTSPLGALAWLTWEQERLIALRASHQGLFQTVPLQVSGRRLQINARVPSSGEVRVQVMGEDGAAVPGRSFSECRPVRGDQLAAPVTWSGREDHGEAAGPPVVLQVALRNAELFALKFV